MSRSIFIAVTGNTFPEISRDQGDFGDWIARGLLADMPVALLDARSAASLPDLSEIAGVVVSGSHEMVTARAAWSEALGDWLRQCVAAGVPVLGICYGHQLLAQACGGEVGFRDAGIEIGTVQVKCLQGAETDPLFAQMPERFTAQVVHHQSVLRPPEGAQVLARSAAEPVQAFRLGRCAWGVQFHPEFSAEAMRGYIAEVFQTEGQSDDWRVQLCDAVEDTPVAASMLRHFARLIRNEEHCGQVELPGGAASADHKVVS